MNRTISSYPRSGDICVNTILVAPKLHEWEAKVRLGWLLHPTGCSDIMWSSGTAGGDYLCATEQKEKAWQRQANSYFRLWMALYQWSLLMCWSFLLPLLFVTPSVPFLVSHTRGYMNFTTLKAELCSCINHMRHLNSPSVLSQRNCWSRWHPAANICDDPSQHPPDVFLYGDVLHLPIQKTAG